MHRSCTNEYTSVTVQIPGLSFKTFIKIAQCTFEKKWIWNVDGPWMRLIVVTWRHRVSISADREREREKEKEMDECEQTNTGAAWHSCLSKTSLDQALYAREQFISTDNTRWVRSYHCMVAPRAGVDRTYIIPLPLLVWFSLVSDSCRIYDVSTARNFRVSKSNVLSEVDHIRHRYQK